MVLSKFLECGLLVHTIHDFTEEEKDSLLTQGYYEIADEDLELYETLHYGYNFETGKPKELPFLKQSFEDFKRQVLSRIDSATSKAIFSGFEYDINDEILHFSYDSLDQQNFADTANAAILAKQEIAEVPQTITWNGWRNHTSENKGELVRLTLDADTFLNLYTKGALAHKAKYMEIGGQRKNIVESCSTVEELNDLLEKWEL